MRNWATRCARCCDSEYALFPYNLHIIRAHLALVRLDAFSTTSFSAEDVWKFIGRWWLRRVDRVPVVSRSLLSLSFITSSYWFAYAFRLSEKQRSPSSTLTPALRVCPRTTFCGSGFFQLLIRFTSRSATVCSPREAPQIMIKYGERTV